MKAFIPYEFGINGNWNSAFDPKPSHTKRLRKLLKLEEADLILKICKHYISNFIPDAVKNEDTYWIISCYPSTDKSPVRVSIWFPEVFNISSNYVRYSDELHCMVFVHSDYMGTDVRRELEEKVPGLLFYPGYRFVTGIKEQLAVFMPLNSYFDFVKDERVYEAVRAHNYELTLKGRTPFKRGHNHEFVRYLFGDESWLEGN